MTQLTPEQETILRDAGADPSAPDFAEKLAGLKKKVDDLGTFRKELAERMNRGVPAGHEISASAVTVGAMKSYLDNRMVSMEQHANELAAARQEARAKTEGAAVVSSGPSWQKAAWDYVRPKLGWIVALVFAGVGIWYISQSSTSGQPQQQPAPAAASNQEMTEEEIRQLLMPEESPTTSNAQ